MFMFLTWLPLWEENTLEKISSEKIVSEREIHSKSHVVSEKFPLRLLESFPK